MEKRGRFLHSPKVADRFVKLVSIFSALANINNGKYATEGKILVQLIGTISREKRLDSSKTFASLLHFSV